MSADTMCREGVARAVPFIVSHRGPNTIGCLCRQSASVRGHSRNTTPHSSVRCRPRRGRDGGGHESSPVDIHKIMVVLMDEVRKGRIRKEQPGKISLCVATLLSPVSAAPSAYCMTLIVVGSRGPRVVNTTRSSSSTSRNQILGEADS